MGTARGNTGNTASATKNRLWGEIEFEDWIKLTAEEQAKARSDAEIRRINLKWDRRAVQRREYAKRYYREKKLKLAGRPEPAYCEVCQQPTTRRGQSLALDHDHKTGRFRGWLCMHCNVILGHAGDSPGLLRALADYLLTQ